MMLSFKRTPITKKVEELEFLDANLIHNVPLEYAYIMPKSNRVIQKENKEALLAIIIEDPYSIEYVKMGSEKDFECIKSIPALNDLQKQSKGEFAKKRLISLIFVVVTTLAFLFIGDSNDFWLSPITWIFGVFYLALFTVYVYRIVKAKALD